MKKHIKRVDRLTTLVCTCGDKHHSPRGFRRVKIKVGGKPQMRWIER